MAHSIVESDGDWLKLYFPCSDSNNHDGLAYAKIGNITIKGSKANIARTGHGQLVGMMIVWDAPLTPLQAKIADDLMHQMIPFGKH